jgi:hypothetical protein
MHDARPHREPDETAVPERVARGANQEHAECRVDAEDHLLILRLRRIPAPSGWPHDHERKDARDEDRPDDDQHNAEIRQLLTVLHSLSLDGSRLSRLHQM